MVSISSFSSSSVQHDIHVVDYGSARVIRPQSRMGDAMPCPVWKLSVFSSNDVNPFCQVCKRIKSSKHICCVNPLSNYVWLPPCVLMLSVRLLALLQSRSCVLLLPIGLKLITPSRPTAWLCSQTLFQFGWQKEILKRYM